MVAVLIALQIGSLAPPVSFVVESKPTPIDTYKGIWLAVAAGLSPDAQRNLRNVEAEDNTIKVVFLEEQDRKAKEQLQLDPGPRMILFNQNLRLVKRWDVEPQGGFAASLRTWLEKRSLEPGETAPDPRRFLIESGALDTKFQKQKEEIGLLVLFLQTDGPVDILYSDRLKTIGETSKTSKIAVVGLFPAVHETLETVQSLERVLGFPCVIDPGAAFADAFRATCTPEAFLIDANGRVVYTGAIDSNTWESPDTRPYLIDAIAALASGKPIRPNKTFPFGTAFKKAGVDP